MLISHAKIIALLTACLLAGSAAVAQRATFPTIPTSGHADLHSITEGLLSTFAPAGKYIIDRCNQAPSVFNLDNLTVRMNACPNYLQWVNGHSTDEVIAGLSSAVHEMTHDYQFRVAYAILGEEKKPVREGDQYHAYFTGDDTVLVKQTPVFPTSEMAELFPPELRTARFPIYVYPACQTGSHVDGIYGLLDEFDAYYMGTKTAMDFLPYYQQTAKTPENWFAFLDDVHRQYFAYAEFKLYMLNYLRFARDRYPAIYRGIMVNRQFKQAFCAVESGYARVLTDFFSAKAGIFAHLRAAGYQVSEDEDNITVYRKDGSYLGHSNFLRSYHTLTAELSKPVYQGMMAEMEK